MWIAAARQDSCRSPRCRAAAQLQSPQGCGAPRLGVAASQPEAAQADVVKDEQAWRHAQRLLGHGPVGHHGAARGQRLGAGCRRLACRGEAPSCRSSGARENSRQSWRAGALRSTACPAHLTRSQRSMPGAAQRAQRTRHAVQRQLGRVQPRLPDRRPRLARCGHHRCAQLSQLRLGLGPAPGCSRGRPNLCRVCARVQQGVQQEGMPDSCRVSARVQQGVRQEGMPVLCLAGLLACPAGRE